MKSQVPDYKLNGSLPDKWKLELEGQNKGALLKDGKTVGQIEVIGYYGDKVDLPNHTTLVKTEEVNTGLGRGNLYLLNQSDPAASSKKSWMKLYAVIPVKDQNMAFGVWVDSDNTQLTKDMVVIKEILSVLAMK